jgi:hypothetical protein
MITITLNEESGITVGELSVYPSKDKITGFVDVKTNGVSWYFSSIWKYGTSEDFKDENNVTFDNLPFGLDRAILNEEGEENYPSTDGGYTDYRVMIYRACDMFKQVLEKEYPNLSGQIEVTGMPK